MKITVASSMTKLTITSDQIATTPAESLVRLGIAPLIIDVANIDAKPTTDP